MGEDTFFMACSCPLGSAVGWVDGARVSADTSDRWRAYPIPWDKTNAPAARNAVRNTVSRQAMHRSWFLNNPDCLVLRDGSGCGEFISGFLSPDQVKGCISVSVLSGGLLFLTDNLGKLAPPRLKMASTLFPHAFSGCRAVDDGGQGECSELLVQHMEAPEGCYDVVALCNWTGAADARAATLDSLGVTPLSGQVVHAFEWWSSTCTRGWAGTLSCASVPAHSARVFALRVRDESDAVYLGSDIHMSCGKELASWRSWKGGFEARVELGRHSEGSIWFYIPSGDVPRMSGTACMGEQAMRAHDSRQGTWCVRVRVEPGGSTISATW